MTEEDNSIVLKGDDGLFPLSSTTVGQELYYALCKAEKNTIAMVNAFTEETITTFDLLQQSVNLAQALRLHKYDQQNTVIALSSENSLQFYVPVLASFFNASILAPMNHNYTPLELEHCLNISKPKVVFCSEALVQKYIGLKSKLPFIEKIIVLDSRNDIYGSESIHTFVSFALKGATEEIHEFQPYGGYSKSMGAVILASSGTTGLPKGVLLSHFNLVSMFVLRASQKSVKATSKATMGLLPFFHSYGFFVGIMNLKDVIKIVVLPKFDEDLFLKTIQDYKLDTLALAPPLMLFLAKSDKVKKYDLSSVKEILCGAAPLSKSVENEVLRRLKCGYIVQGYGLTENTLVAVMNKDDFFKSGSCGKACDLTSIKFRDPETGKCCAANEVGELCIKGPGVMMGYYNNPVATKESFTKDGWLKTGDLGYFDDEKFIFIIDRLKELIKYKGYQVAPAELEALLINHPQINDVGVVGLPDESVGEKPLAFVVKKPEVNLSESDVKTYVADRLSPQKRLTGGVIFVSSIPKNPSGKILRKELRKLLSDKTKLLKSKL